MSISRSQSIAPRSLLKCSDGATFPSSAKFAGAGRVTRTGGGLTHSCGIDPRPLARADEWLRHYERLWDTRIERLVELLRHPDNDPSDSE